MKRVFVAVFLVTALPAIAQEYQLIPNAPAGSCASNYNGCRVQCQRMSCEMRCAEKYNMCATPGTERSGKWRNDDGVEKVNLIQR